MPDQDSKTVLAVVNDIFFQAKISGAAKQAGVTLKYVTTEKDLFEKARMNPAFVVFDLNFTAVAPIALIEKLKSDPALRGIRLLAYLSHVQTDLQKMAIAAGCDEVMPRSAFSMNMNRIFAG
jgi:ActR/RegA family two-component response regulator